MRLAVPFPGIAGQCACTGAGAGQRGSAVGIGTATDCPDSRAEIPAGRRSEPGALAWAIPRSFEGAAAGVRALLSRSCGTQSRRLGTTPPVPPKSVPAQLTAMASATEQDVRPQGDAARGCRGADSRRSSRGRTRTPSRSRFLRGCRRIADVSGTVYGSGVRGHAQCALVQVEQGLLLGTVVAVDLP